MYTDYYLKFVDEATANSILYSEESVLQEDVVETINVPKYSAIDVIGTIYEPTGKMITVEDQEVPEMKPVPGFHVNVRHDSTAPELEEYKVTPTTPTRSWF